MRASAWPLSLPSFSGSGARHEDADRARAAGLAGSGWARSCGTRSLLELDTEAVTLRDYVAWHDDYGRLGSRLHLRLVVVRDLLAEALDELPDGPLRVISMCAGQGHDVVTVARRHRRGSDLLGRLVEHHPHNAAVARAAIAAAGLAGLEVIEGDAGSSDAYAGACPANVVLVCGVLGNISDGEIERTLRFLPRLCAPDAWVVWTRGPRPAGIIDKIEGWLVDVGFEPQRLVVPDAPPFGVGAARLVGPTQPFETGVRLFEFRR